MKTDDLVAMLSTGNVAVPRRSASGRIGLAVLAGLPVSLFILFAEYGMRRDIVQAMFWPMFWVKVVFPLCIAAAGFVAVQRLARPGVPARHAWTGAALPVIGISPFWQMAISGTAILLAVIFNSRGERRRGRIILKKAEVL